MYNKHTTVIEINFILSRKNKEQFDKISCYFRVTKYILPLQGNAVTAIELTYMILWLLYFSFRKF